MTYKKLFLFAMLTAVVLVVAQPSFAQARIGTVQGTVKDPTGALVPDAEVTITQPVTRYKQTTQTDWTGTFKLVNIPFNTYNVTVKATGFQATEEAIDLESTVPLNLELTLAITGTEAEVTITENSTALLEPDRSSSDTDISQSILERPMGATPSRAIESIVASAPGFVTDDNGRMQRSRRRGLS